MARTTWINGPLGLQERANAERFAWEAAETAAQPISVQVYFSRHPESDADFTAVFPRPRTVQPQGQRVASAAIKALVGRADRGRGGAELLLGAGWDAERPVHL